MPTDRRKLRTGWRYRYRKMLRGVKLESRYIYPTAEEAGRAEIAAIEKFYANGMIPSDSENTLTAETVNRLLARRVKWLQVNKSPRHAYDTEWCFKRAMSYVQDWMELPAEAITEEMAIDLKQKWGEDLRGRRKGMSDCNRGLTYLQSAWNGPWDSRRARREYAFNPFAFVDRYAHEKRAKRIPTSQQIVTLLGAATDREKKLYLEILEATGARPGEALRLQKEDAIVHEEPYGVILWTKKKKGGIRTPRRVGIDEYLAFQIRRWLKDHPENVFLFQQERKKSAPPAARVNRWVANLQRDACKAAKIPYFTPHCYRHYFASKQSMEGKSLVEIQHLLGHDDAETTAKYLHELLGVLA